MSIFVLFMTRIKSYCPAMGQSQQVSWSSASRDCAVFCLLCCPVDTRYASVILPLLISSPCVARQVVVRRKSGSTEHQRSCNRRELISTGRQTHEVRVKRMATAQPVGTFSVPRPFQVLCMLKTCHWIDPTSPDEERISPHVTGRQAYKQRMRTDTNGLKIGVYVSRPLMLSGKVWHPFNP